MNSSKESGRKSAGSIRWPPKDLVEAVARHAVVLLDGLQVKARGLPPMTRFDFAESGALLTAVFHRARLRRCSRSMPWKNVMDVDVQVEVFEISIGSPLRKSSLPSFMSRAIRPL